MKELNIRFLIDKELEGEQYHRIPDDFDLLEFEMEVEELLKGKLKGE